MDNRLKLFLFGAELDCDPLVAEAWGEWRAVFEVLATQLDFLFYAMPRAPIRADFRLFIDGEEVNLDALTELVGRDWRLILDRLAPRLDSIFIPGANLVELTS
jgi:hypothetical protein